MTSAVAGYGTKIGLGNSASPIVYNKIAEVLSISGPELSRETLEVTSLDSTAKEYIAGLQDGGSISLEMNWISGNSYQQAMRALVTSGSSANFLIEWPNSPKTRVSFTAVAESWAINTEPNAAITASMSLKISGAPNWSTTKTVTG